MGERRKRPFGPSNAYCGYFAYIFGQTYIYDDSLQVGSSSQTSVEGTQHYYVWKVRERLVIFTYKTLSYCKWLFFGMFEGVFKEVTKVRQGGSVKCENGKKNTAKCGHLKHNEN